MIQAIKNMLGLAPKINYADLVRKGAQIIDVRTKREFQQGNIPGSINIPLDTLSGSYSKIKKDKPVITCCASGVRSAQGKRMLKSNGFSEVHNGGGWRSLNSKIK